MTTTTTTEARDESELWAAVEKRGAVAGPATVEPPLTEEELGVLHQTTALSEQYQRASDREDYRRQAQLAPELRALRTRALALRVAARALGA